MYNFLDHRLLPKVSTKTACTDGFEAANLINSDYLMKSRGFIAYSTMKPPIDVDFELICNVNLSHIVVNATNGKQKCCGIEIFAKTPNTGFVTISKVFFKEDGIVVCNARSYSKKKRPENTSEGFCLVFFKSNEFRTFLNASSIRIRILRTENLIPCLGSVEIWGRVSKNCSKVTVETVNKLLHREEKLVKVNVEKANTEQENGFDIPEEFKDELTYEVMSLPMTLPSGHSVDQSTLDKCVLTDASCGRHPCDPFTGLRYCDARKPVLNVALKTRIDMFLIQHSHRSETFSVKRTLGRANSYSLLEMSDADYSDFAENTKKIKLDSVNSGSSLEETVNKVLNNESFTRFTVDVNEKKKAVNNCCSKCKNTSILYIIPCKHIFCRVCLFNIKDTCDICDLKFLKKDPHRYHY